MSDILSQDQIDSLLTGGLDAGGGGAGVMDGAQEATIDRYPALNKVFNLFCAQAGNVISTVINKKTTFSPESCEKANFASIQAKIKAVVLSLNLSFKAGVTGDFYLIIQKKDVALLSDLMMMGDGSAEYSEDHKDAIGELFNQVMGAVATALTSELGGAVSAGAVEVQEFDLDNPPFPADSLDMGIAQLKVEGSSDSFVALLFPDSLSEQFAEKTTIEQPADVTESDKGGSGDKIGLNMSELDDLSKVASTFDSSDEQFRETSLSGETVAGPRENIDMLLDIELDVNIELGRSNLSIKRVLELAPGSIVELDRMAGEPVDLLVNNKVIAKGEVVVVDENFGIRIVSLVSPEERIKSLK